VKANSTTLAISGSGIADGGSFSVALRNQEKLYSASSSADDRTDLAVLVDRLCKQAGLALQSVTEVRVDIGPGSYIGLRIAVTFARFVAAFGPARLLATDSLQLLAAATSSSDPALLGRRLLPVVAGRAGSLHVAAYRPTEGPNLLQEIAPRTLPEAEFSDLLQRQDLVIAAPETIGQPAQDGQVESRGPAAVSATTLLLPALQFRETAAEALQPLYLMGSYAE